MLDLFSKGPSAHYFLFVSLYLASNLWTNCIDLVFYERSWFFFKGHLMDTSFVASTHATTLSGIDAKALDCFYCKGL